MRLLPSSLFISWYLLANMLLGAYYAFSGSLGGDFKESIISDQNIYLKVYITELLLMVIFLLLLRIVYSSVKVKSKLITSGRFLNVFVAIIQISFLLYSHFTGVGKLSDDFYSTTVDNPLKYIFTFFNADYLFLATFCISKKNSKSNILIYLLSNIYRGWLAGALVNVVFILAAKHFSSRGIKFKYVIICLVGFLFAAPAIYYVKYVTRGAEDINSTPISVYYSGMMYDEMVNAAFSRFQHISETYSIINDIDIIRNGFNEKQFVPFYFENPAKKQLAQAFGYYNDQTITQFAAENILHKIPGNIHVGLLTWLLIEPSLTIGYVLYLMTTFFALVFLLKKLTSSDIWPYCVWITILLALHGWFTSYFMFIWSLFVIYIFKNCALLISTNRVIFKDES